MQASQYTSSPRPYPPSGSRPGIPRAVLREARDRRRDVPLSTPAAVHRQRALVHQHIGLEETDDGVWAIYFNTVLLATLDERDFVTRG
jgi:hypothetical protein